MILERKVIEKIIHNVLSYNFDDRGRLHFSRFSESQQKTYEAESRDWLVRANASASVTFDFISNSDYIALKVDLYPGSSHSWAGFDLYVDGVFCEHKRVEGLGANVISFDLPNGVHRVTLYFPWTTETVVEAVYLSDEASVEPISKRKTVLAFGDSITQGYVAELSSLTYVNQLSRDLDLEIVNQGIGGYYFNEATIDKSIVALKPDLITVAYGTNDYSRYDLREDFLKNTSKYIEKLVELFPDTQILGVLPFYRNDYKNQARQRYRTYSLDEGREILTAIYGRYQNIQVLKETGIPRIPETYISDYLHPNELGFTFIAKGVEKKIEQMLNL